MGFGCLLVLLVAMASHFPEPNAGDEQPKTKLVKAWTWARWAFKAAPAPCSTKSTPSRRKNKSRPCTKTLQGIRQAGSAARTTHYPATASAAETALLQQVQAAQKAKPEIESAMQAADDGDTVTASLNLMTRAAPLNRSGGNSWASWCAAKQAQ